MNKMKGDTYVSPFCELFQMLIEVQNKLNFSVLF